MKTNKKKWKKRKFFCSQTKNFQNGNEDEAKAVGVGGGKLLIKSSVFYSSSLSSSFSAFFFLVFFLSNGFRLSRFWQCSFQIQWKSWLETRRRLHREKTWKIVKQKTEWFSGFSCQRQVWTNFGISFKQIEISFIFKSTAFSHNVQNDCRLLGAHASFFFPVVFPVTPLVKRNNTFDNWKNFRRVYAMSSHVRKC